MNDQTRTPSPEKESKFDARNFFAQKRERWQVNVAGGTDRGHRRKQNEDHYAVFRRTRTSEVLISNLSEEKQKPVIDQAWALLVADGVGGAQFGDIASQLALESTLESSQLATSWIMRLRDLEAQQIQERIEAYVERIQESF